MSQQRVKRDASSVIGINHVGLSVSNLDASLAFYTKGTGAGIARAKRKINQNAERAGGLHSTLRAREVLTFPNGYLEVTEYEREGRDSPKLPVKGPGFTHVCYQSPTTDDIYGRLVEQGATSVSRGSEPIHLLGQGVYYAYARDRDGVMFETEHLNRAPFEGPIWFSHVALVSPDLDRLIAFYSLLLDAKPDRRTNSASGPTFDAVADYDDVSIRAGWFDIGNMILEMWEFTNPKTPQPKGITPFDGIGYNKVAFEVTDIQREYARLRAAGVAFLSEPVLGDECAEVYLRDPDGNLLSLIQPTAESPHSVTRLKQKTW